MKAQISLFLILTIFASCQTKTIVTEDSKSILKIEATTNDSTQYELLIFDNKYNSFLVTQPPMNFYSKDYYENWNIQYVTEWNIRHNNPTHYGDFYETIIDYNQITDYGLELNYKLYNYFLFIEKEYGISLIKRAKTSM